MGSQKYARTTYGEIRTGRVVDAIKFKELECTQEVSLKKLKNEEKKIGR